MEVENVFTITSLDQLVVLEINERVHDILYKASNDIEITEIDIETLKIDSLTLGLIEDNGPFRVIASNLIAKINYILDNIEMEEDDEDICGCGCEEEY
ncbi:MULTISPECIES: hypothetical protein [Methanobacterium]|jgi:hypothetical protein|uniref:Uncharacterized protein n=1 Tax=Methanobacterium veterum TaxID=408577 RepID=A0A9E4ZXD5_9EURY|nr:MULTISPECIES: hypothetical protein [Methanobacterium]MCZ3367084.1 hypothetical protein [Methanobacterium veterum]MCZ3373768.1 hypothetical protein [Methanobacterium veterum]